MPLRPYHINRDWFVEQYGEEGADYAVAMEHFLSKLLAWSGSLIESAGVGIRFEGDAELTVWLADKISSRVSISVFKPITSFLPEVKPGDVLYSVEHRHGKNQFWHDTNIIQWTGMDALRDWVRAVTRPLK